ncbi:anaerobic sulfatase maturase [Alicyclobacillus mengziensis]|uniref:Anaerobic sulfatase maturase n=1 Tax=Alicyclobacillus mengziensis TaxID=2931921 RepID=A0A9X7VZC7_9BACL|nr:anaerobic sulfatase maturase [Alicyclobacillus mengziensis]QSO47489.1 anaerobic sulfatase maturase [Alicyclobacillus mengziensis]
MSQSCSLSEKHGPIGVMWKTVSEDCNLACDYCYYSRVGGKIGPKITRIEPEVLEKFIREYMDICQGQASFAWQGGEPMLAGLEFFETVVSLQAKYARPNTVVSNAIQTNATLMNEEWARFFKRYNFLVGVSLDGPKEVHDVRRVTRSGAGSFDRVMRGVEHLRHTGVDFNILTVIHEGNVNKARELMDFYEQENFRYVQFIPAMDFRAQETSKPPKYLITPEEYGQFLCDAFDIWYNDGQPKTSVRFFDNMLSVYLHREAESCIHRKLCPTTLILEQNGDAYPCDFYISDNYKVGNVGVDSLTDILGNIVYEKFLSMKPTLPEKCVTCEFNRFCHGGCPRNRTWNETSQEVDVDYFCNSYMQIYRYAHERMEKVAEQVRFYWLQEYISSGRKLPGRNDACICGSGRKFKKCCQPLQYRTTSL